MTERFIRGQEYQRLNIDGRLAAKGLRVGEITQTDLMRFMFAVNPIAYVRIPQMQANYTENLINLGFYSGDRLAGVSTGGTYFQSGDRIGEIGFLIISPAERRQGLGRAFTYLTQRELLEYYPDIVVAEIADRTGAVNRILQPLTFRSVGSRRGTNPIYDKDISDPNDRQIYETLLMQQILSSIAAIKP